MHTSCIDWLISNDVTFSGGGHDNKSSWNARLTQWLKLASTYAEHGTRDKTAQRWIITAHSKEAAREKNIVDDRQRARKYLKSLFSATMKCDKNHYLSTNFQLLRNLKNHFSLSWFVSEEKFNAMQLLWVSACWLNDFPAHKINLFNF